MYSGKVDLLISGLPVLLPLRVVQILYTPCIVFAEHISVRQYYLTSLLVCVYVYSRCPHEYYSVHVL